MSINLDDFQPKNKKPDGSGSKSVADSIAASHPPKPEAPDGSQQITMTYNQLMELIKASQPQQPVSKSTEETQLAQTQEQAPVDESNPGTRVIFQSDEFEGEQKPKLFNPYAEDEVFDSEEASQRSISNIRKSAAPRTYTTVGISQSRKNLSMSEVEYTADQLPELSDRKVLTQPEGNHAPSAFIPSKTSMSSSIRRVQVEELELSEAEASRQAAFYSPEIDEYTDEDEFQDDVDFEREQKEKAKKEKKQMKKGGKKKLSSGEIVRRIVLALAIIAIVASGAYLVREYLLHKQNEDFEAEVSNLIITTVPTTEEKPTKKSDKNKTDETTKLEETTQKVLTPEEQMAQIKAEYPSVAFPAGLQLKYARLYAKNQDLVGYLEADGSRLSLPIVQTSEADAQNRYLKTNFYGASTKYGCPFLSVYNGVEALSDNTVIYGHHMNDGTIFGAIDIYKTLDGFKRAPIIKFNTLYADHNWKVIAAFITNDDSADDNDYKFVYSFTHFENQTDIKTYTNELAKRSLYSTGVDVQTGDKLLTLSTCSHEFDNARFVVVARLVRAGESLDIDMSKATVNPNPRYPQAWYDKKKKDNPFKNEQNIWFTNL